MNLPLKGLLVVSLEQAVAAPFCSSRLADAGARVIKIERKEGDFARNYDHVVHGESAYFVWLNRGKQSICLDIKNAEDNALLKKIIQNADVFIQNLAPGAAARGGLGSEALISRNPRLITVDISGYGEEGQYSQMKAYDMLVQCETGLASITGSATEPGRVGVSLCDIACGMYAHAAILQALIERQQIGRGKSLKVSLFDSLADWMNVPLLHHDYGGAAPARVGLNHPSIAPYGAYACADGKQLVISIQNQREWKNFCLMVLKRADIFDHIKYARNVDRVANRVALDREIDAVFGSLAHEDLIDRLRAGKIAYGAVNSVKDLSAHSQLRRIEFNTPTGPVSMASPPVQTPGEEPLFNDVPELGQHSESIRQEFGG
ncbi:MAG: CoA transferase [Candidatus Berkelbacteria bacterium]|nr:CoA transferase [Candidatus Berkelbacteria bacterium]